MVSKKLVQLNLGIPEHYRDQLRKMAAEQILANPGQVVSGASIAAEILVRQLDKICENKMEEKNNG